MELAHIEFSKLKISKCNMRDRDPPPDVSDILPSIRVKGVLQPLIVRPEDGRFGIVAGRRRWFSLKAVKEKMGEVAAPPCAIMARNIFSSASVTKDRIAVGSTEASTSTLPATSSRCSASNKRT